MANVLSKTGQGTNALEGMTMAQGIHTVAEMSAFYQSPASASLRAAVHAAGERLGKGTRAERAQAKADYKAALNAIRDAVSALKA